MLSNLFVGDEMFVLFVSRSEKKAQETVRRILDNYADRIGNDVWRTVITQEGLDAVRAVLRKNATKNMAVACHWIRSRRQSEILWIVGRRECFNEEGIVPIGTTEKNLAHNEWQNDWQYFNLVKDFTALAALFHDLGKTNDFFQKKLNSRKPIADPVRHEWISCKLLEIMSGADEEQWLKDLAIGKWDEQDLLSRIHSLSEDKWKQKKQNGPVIGILQWLILTHHRMPNLIKEKRIGAEGTGITTFESMLQSIQVNWGYETETQASSKDLEQCFQFTKGLMGKKCTVWYKNVQKWSKRLLKDYSRLKQIWKEDHADKETSPLRLIVHQARLCMMLADHYCSSCDKDAENQKQFYQNDIWANTTPNGQKKQLLEEHLVGVMRQALKIAWNLPGFTNHMERAYDIRALKNRSPKPFHWQDKAVDKIIEARKQSDTQNTFFVVNMASTGCGKTFANAKIMKAISPDQESLRFVLTLGLRTLTLQTGDEYKNRMQLSQQDLAVLIGSRAVMELHKKDQNQENCGENEPLLPEKLNWFDTNNEEQLAFLNLFFDERKAAFSLKNKEFLYKPILVTTIDHMMSATETIRGGRYILTCLRLLSSDLVIDEIDDFGPGDLIAIARLVHLAGMYGRNVLISSATIPSDLAEAMYRSYQDGLKCWNSFHSENRQCISVICDEFRTMTEPMKARDAYQHLHVRFIEKRVESLIRQPVKRRGYIAPAADVSIDGGTAEEKYFDSIRRQMLRLHESNHVIDEKTGKKISYGVVRMANIAPCVALSQYLLKCDLPNDTAIRFMTYHSRQILLLRHLQEKYLDKILNRKKEKSDRVQLNDPVLRNHIDQVEEKNILFVVVATPVEEVGRDHDFDWAVVEPSSYRSIIQLAGRVRRHRPNRENLPENMAIMEYNIRGIRNRERAFIRPGYEEGKYILESHDLCKILDEKKLENRIDAIPRIQKNSPLEPTKRLIDLEQAVMKDLNSKSDEGPQCINGWNEECWWMTGLPQQINPFRRNTMKEVEITAYYDAGKVAFCESDGIKYNECTMKYGIQDAPDFSEDMKKRFWIRREYLDALRTTTGGNIGLGDEEYEKKLRETSERYGTLSMPVSDDSNEHWLYSDQFGLYRKDSQEVQHG